jgi:hypothetical protein
MAEEFHELRNFMNAWSQEQEEELHESSANRLYECKPVKMIGNALLHQQEVNQQDQQEV